MHVLLFLNSIWGEKIAGKAGNLKFETLNADFSNKRLPIKNQCMPSQNTYMLYTLLGGSSFARFCQQEVGEFPRLVGRYCSYLLPKQARRTTQILVDKTSPMTGRLRV